MTRFFHALFRGSLAFLFCFGAVFASAVRVSAAVPTSASISASKCRGNPAWTRAGSPDRRSPDAIAFSVTEGYQGASAALGEALRALESQDLELREDEAQLEALQEEIGAGDPTPEQALELAALNSLIAEERERIFNYQQIINLIQQILDSMSVTEIEYWIDVLKLLRTTKICEQASWSRQAAGSGSEFGGELQTQFGTTGQPEEK